MFRLVRLANECRCGVKLYKQIVDNEVSYLCKDCGIIYDIDPCDEVRLLPINNIPKDYDKIIKALKKQVE